LPTDFSTESDWRFTSRRAVLALAEEDLRWSREVLNVVADFADAPSELCALLDADLMEARLRPLWAALDCS
jgi:hypothetical protein